MYQHLLLFQLVLYLFIFKALFPFRLRRNYSLAALYLFPIKPSLKSQGFFYHLYISILSQHFNALYVNKTLFTNQYKYYQQ